MASKKTKVVSGRVPHNVVEEMNMHDLNVAECVQIALKSKRDPTVLLRIELRSLLSEKENLASRLADVSTRIDECKQKLNITKSDDELKEELFVDDNEKAVQQLLDKYESERGTTTLLIGDFINTTKTQRYIDGLLRKCDMTKEDFICAVIEKYERSIQTTLDS